MKIPRYAPEDLVMFATVIAVSARQRDWAVDMLPAGGGSGKQTVTEVQCMTLGREGLYVACNGGEHLAVQHFFNAYGVSNHKTLIECLRYSLWILTLDQPSRGPEVGKGYNAPNLGDELTNINRGGRAKYLAPLTPVEIATVKRLVMCTVLPEAKERKLAWFVKKLAQSRPLAGLAPPGADTSICSATYKAASDFVLLDTGGAAHAELKLLSLLATACIKNTLPSAHRTVAIAGLKIACKGCAPWMKRFSNWVGTKYEVRLTHEVQDRLGEPHAAAGERPVNAATDTLGTYVRALFNGTSTANFLDVDAAVDDANRPNYVI